MMYHKETSIAAQRAAEREEAEKIALARETAALARMLAASMDALTDGQALAMPRLFPAWEEVLAGVLLSWEAEEPLASPQPTRTVNSRARLSRSAAPRRKRLVCFMCVTSFLKRLDLRDGARLPQPWRKLWKKRAGKRGRG